jgi:hypothetical protein
MEDQYALEEPLRFNALPMARVKAESLSQPPITAFGLDPPVMESKLKDSKLPTLVAELEHPHLLAPSPPLMLALLLLELVAFGILLKPSI